MNARGVTEVTRRGWFIALAAVAVLAAAALYLTDAYAGASALDFSQYWTASLVAETAGLEALYRLGLDREVPPRAEAAAAAIAGQDGYLPLADLHPVSPPTFYLVFQPLRRLSFERAFLACHVLGLLGVALAVVAVGAALRASTGAILLWIAIAAALFAPVLADAYVGNITRLQIGLLGAFVWCLAGESPRRNLAGGAILGLDLLVKPSTPSIVMFGLMLVLSDRWRRPWGRALATAAATVAAGIALTSLCFGSPRSWLLWRQAAEQLRDAPPTLAAANYSLLAWIDEVAGGWAGCAFALAVLAAAAQGLWRRAQAAEPGPAGAGAVAALLVGLGGLATTLTERLVWPQYFTLAIPALLYVFRPAPVQTAGAARAWAVHAAAALPVVLFVLPRLVRGSTHTAGFLLFNGGAALLLGCLLFGDQRRGPSAHDGRTAQ